MDAWSATGVVADPGRVHTEGRMARATLEGARDQVSALFGVRPRQVILTSGGTEAINAAVWGATRSGPGPVACAEVEHSAVRDASARSGPVVTIAVDHLGRIHPDAVTAAIGRSRADFGGPPVLVHCQWANHEVGDGPTGGRGGRGGPPTRRTGPRGCGGRSRTLPAGP